MQAQVLQITLLTFSILLSLSLEWICIESKEMPQETNKQNSTARRYV